MRQVAKRFSIEGTLLLVLILSVVLTCTTPAFCYFTTYVSAGGVGIVDLGTTIDIEEEVDGYTKTVRIVNTGDFDCFVRVSCVCPEGYRVRPNYKVAEWAKPTSKHVEWVNTEVGGPWYYFISPVTAGGSTTEIQFFIQNADGSEITDVPADFNVMVLAEACPEVADESGNIVPWWGYEEVAE